MPSLGAAGTFCDQRRAPAHLAHGGRRGWLSGYRFSCGSGSRARYQGSLHREGTLPIPFCSGLWVGLGWGALQGPCASSLCVGRRGVSSYRFSCGAGSLERFRRLPGARQPRPFGAPVCRLPVLGTVPSSGVPAWNPAHLLHQPRPAGYSCPRWQGCLLHRLFRLLLSTAPGGWGWLWLGHHWGFHHLLRRPRPTGYSCPRQWVCLLRRMGRLLLSTALVMFGLGVCVPFPSAWGLGWGRWFGPVTSFLAASRRTHNLCGFLKGPLCSYCVP